MIWLVPALLVPFLHAWANILDNYLVNHLFQRVWTLTFYSNLTNLFFIPLVLLIELPSIPPIALWPIFLLLSLIQVFYLYPYYKALQHQDTSIVSALFALGHVLVPLLAFFIVGETLPWQQYLGFGLIIFASAILSINRAHAVPLNRSFVYMLFCSVLLSFEVVLYKYLFQDVSWSTGFVWTTILSFIIVLSFLFVASWRQDILNQWSTFRNKFLLFTGEELLTFSGSAAATLAISLGSVTLVSAVESLQPLYVLLFALVLKQLWPKLFKEDISLALLAKK